jgi:hypothetical protein
MVARRWRAGGIGLVLTLMAAPIGGAAAAEAVIRNVDAPGLTEASGLARSHVHPGRLWTHNDSGSPAELYAVPLEDGSPVTAFPLRRGFNLDWEDLASFVRDGRPYLLVADVGDNWAFRGQVSLHWVEEPADLESVRDLGPVYTRHFSYPDGPRDVEAVAVDPDSLAVYLISKRDDPPRLYRLALDGLPPPAVNRAEALGSLRLPDRAKGRRARWITALDFDGRGRRAAVLSLSQVYLYDRRPEESWASAFSRLPRVIPLPRLRQAEGLALNAAGDQLWVNSEGRPMPLVELALPPLPEAGQR